MILALCIYQNDKVVLGVVKFELCFSVIYFLFTQESFNLGSLPFTFLSCIRVRSDVNWCSELGGIIQKLITKIKSTVDWSYACLVLDFTFMNNCGILSFILFILIMYYFIYFIRPQFPPPKGSAYLTIKTK